MNNKILITGLLLASSIGFSVIGSEFSNQEMVRPEFDAKRFAEDIVDRIYPITKKYNYSELILIDKFLKMFVARFKESLNTSPLDNQSSDAITHMLETVRNACAKIKSEGSKIAKMLKNKEGESRAQVFVQHNDQLLNSLLQSVNTIQNMLNQNK